MRLTSILVLLAACSAPAVDPVDTARDPAPLDPAPVALTLAPSIDPSQEIDGLLDVADEAIAGERLDDALAALEKAESLSDEDARASLRLADLFYAHRRYESAADRYSEALARGAREEHVHIRHGHALYALGRLDAAKVAYLSGLAEYPESDSPLRNGLYFLAGSDWAAAGDLLAEATRAVPDSPTAWSYYGFSLALTKQWTAARAALLRSEALGPLSANDLVVLARAEAAGGDIDAARGRLRDALELDPNHQAAALEFEKLIRPAGGEAVSPADVLAGYDELAGLAPSNPSVQNNCGFVLRNMAEELGAANTVDIPDGVRALLERSVKAYETVAALVPDDPQFQSDTGLVYEFYPAIRNDPKALRFFVRALEMSGHVYRDAFNGLERVCTRSGDWETLAMHAEKVVEALESGREGVAPGGSDGAPCALPPAGTDIMLTAARAALDMSRRIIARGGTQPEADTAASDGCPWPLDQVAVTPLPLPEGWTIERPESRPEGEAVTVGHRFDPAFAWVFASRSDSDLAQRGRSTKGRFDTHGRAVVRDRAGNGGPWTMDFPFSVLRSEMGTVDALAASAKLLDSPRASARVTSGGVVDGDSIETEGAFGYMERVARSVPIKAIVTLPGRPVRAGETWDIDAEAVLRRAAMLTLNDASIEATGYATLTGFEEVDGVRCARIETVLAGTATGSRIEFQPGLYAKGTLRIRRREVVLHGVDGYTRKTVSTEEQRVVAEIALMPGSVVGLTSTSTTTQLGRPERVATD